MESSLLALIGQGFAHCFMPFNLLVMVVSLAAGIIGGMLPGITVVTAVALFIPFTFAMPVEAALIGMGAVYVGAMYGGSNASILINTPGSPGSIATCFDGYAMTRKGLAEQAICTALLASAVGGVIGAVLLLLFFEPLCTIGLKFGSEAFFWMAIFGLTSLGVMEPGNLLRTLLAGALGLAINTVGLDPVMGAMRFTFDSYELVQGFDMVLLMISLFSFSQMLMLVEERSSYIAAYSKQEHPLRNAFRDLMGCKLIASLCSVLGTLIGSLPGAGGSIAAILAYNETRRWKKSKTAQFGTGIPEGIIAPESANNASVGGALVPLMALGIPGSGAAAVLMGGLLAKGLVPGPQLLEKSADVAYTFITSLIVVNPFMIVVGYLLAKICTRILDVPKSLVIPVVFTLSFLGGFAVRNSMFDVMVLVVSGVAAYFLLKARISPAAIGLGVVLGPIIEESLVTSVFRSGSTEEFVQLMVFSPLAFLFLLLSVAAIVMALVVNRKQTVLRAPSFSWSVVRSYDFIILSLVALVALFFLLQSFRLEGIERLFPTVVFTICLGLSAMSLGCLFMAPSRGKPVCRRAKIDIFVYILIAALTYVAIEILGFYTAIFMCNMSMMVYGSLESDGFDMKKALLKPAAVACCVTVVQYLLFDALLDVPTPSGLLV